MWKKLKTKICNFFYRLFHSKETRVKNLLKETSVYLNALYKAKSTPTEKLSEDYKRVLGIEKSWHTKECEAEFAKLKLKPRDSLTETEKVDLFGHYVTEETRKQMEEANQIRLRIEQVYHYDPLC